jgi:hypothetical protein
VRQKISSLFFGIFAWDYFNALALKIRVIENYETKPGFSGTKGLEKGKTLLYQMPRGYTEGAGKGR